MGSAEGFGGGVVVTEVGRQSGVACSSVVQKEIQAVNILAPALWSKIPDSELCRQACQPPSIHNDNVTKEHGLDNTNSPSLELDLGAKLVLGKTGKLPRSNTVCMKRSGMVPMEVSKSKSGILDVDGMSPELASHPASRNTLEKTQMVKQRNSSNGRRDKRNGKVHKNRCDSISLKNGLVSFNSAAGGNNFFGIYGLKSDVYDITKYANEIPLDELLHGNYHCPSIAKDNGKKAVNSNSSLLQSVRKACSVLQAQKVLQTEKCSEIEHSCNRKVSTSSVAASSTASESDGDKGDCCAADPSSFHKVQESVDKMKTSTLVVDSPIYQPKDILERLALSPPKDLESLLFDAGKPASSLKNGNDSRLGKSVSHRTGLPPFPWSHSFSGHNKLGADAIKLSANRTICHGRWVKVPNSTSLLRDSADLSIDLESLTFDHSLVPSVNLKSEHPKNEIAPIEQLLSSSEVCSTSKVAADEQSPMYAAAQVLCEMAVHSSKKNPHATVKLLKKPSQIAMKACKLKAIEKSDKWCDAPKSTMGTPNLIKVGDEGFPSKKLKLSPDIKNAYISRTDSVRKGVINWSTPQPVRSPPTKLFREPKAELDSYNINLVKKSYLMKPPRATERPGISQQKIRKVVQMKWNRSEG